MSLRPSRRALGQAIGRIAVARPAADSISAACCIRGSAVTAWARPQAAAAVDRIVLARVMTRPTAASAQAACLACGLRNLPGLLLVVVAVRCVEAALFAPAYTNAKTCILKGEGQYTYQVCAAEKMSPTTNPSKVLTEFLMLPLVTCNEASCNNG